METLMKENRVKPKRSFRQIFGTILLIAGAALIGCALLLSLHNLYTQKMADNAITAVEDAVIPVIDEKAKEAAEDDTSLTDPALLAGREMPTVTVDGYAYIGELYVPDYDMKLPILSAFSMDNLEISPARYAGNIYDGSLVIAGHNYRKHFSPLRWLPMGSEIDFIDAEGNTWRYELSYVEILQPDEADRLVSTSDDYDLTLFTCTIGGQSRYTMRLTLMEDMEEE